MLRTRQSSIYDVIELTLMYRMSDAGPLPAGVLSPDLLGRYFSAEVACLPLALKHSLSLLRIKNASDRCRQPLPLTGFFHELFAAGTRQEIKAGLAVIDRGSPFRRNPSAIFKALKRRVKGSVFDQKLFIRRLLDSASDALAVLRSKNQRAQGQQVQGTL